MSTNSFFKLIRSYAAIHRRTGVDYSGAVRAVLDLRMATIAREVSDEDAVKRLQAAAARAASREYGETIVFP
jgi:hypothetical protein